MRKNLPTGQIPTLLFVTLFLICVVNGKAQTMNPAIELKSGDRVVLLGSALAENEQFYNYLEFGISRHWPEKSITFRNLGWSGDNVHGDARSYYTSPPSPYELLLKQLTEANPTHVLLAYGSVEAQEGIEGIEKFEKGLEKLILKCNELGSKAIFLSPIPQFGGATPEYIESRNRELQRYADKIHQIAQKHGGAYIDLIKAFSELNFTPSDDGVHLNEAGYYVLSEMVEDALGLSSPSQHLTIGSEGTVESQQIVHLEVFDPKNGVLSFRTEAKILPKPLPSSQTPGHPDTPIFAIKGLKKGYYTLFANGEQVASASAKTWAEGVPVHQGGNWNQAEYLRRLLNKKDEAFFFKYRPLNRTYIIGFREYEQGRHLKELEDFDIVLTWLQGQITAAKKPLPVHYQLKPTP